MGNCAADALTCFCIRHAIPLYQAASLRVRITRDNDDRVEITIPAHFVQKRNIGDRVGNFLDVQCREPLISGASDLGVHNRLQRSPRLGVGKDDSRDVLTVERPVCLQHLLAKAGNHRGQAGRAGSDGVTGKFVSIDRGNAECLQSGLARSSCLRQCRPSGRRVGHQSAPRHASQRLVLRDLEASHRRHARVRGPERVHHEHRNR